MLSQEGNVCWRADGRTDGLTDGLTGGRGRTDGRAAVENVAKQVRKHVILWGDAPCIQDAMTQADAGPDNSL